jgi:hypothetical protein
VLVAVGSDYNLLLLSRYKEEIRGRCPGPVGLIQRAFNDAAGEVVQLDLVPQPRTSSGVGTVAAMRTGGRGPVGQSGSAPVRRTVPGNHQRGRCVYIER